MGGLPWPQVKGLVATLAKDSAAPRGQSGGTSSESGRGCSALETRAPSWPGLGENCPTATARVAFPQEKGQLEAPMQKICGPRGGDCLTVWAWSCATQPGSAAPRPQQSRAPATPSTSPFPADLPARRCVGTH